MSEESIMMEHEEKEVRKVVQSFYDAFNSHDFSRAPAYTADDWNHINPLGGWKRGRDEVLEELKEVHSTFLRGVKDTVEEMSVRFVVSDVAVVTVPSTLFGSFTTPDGVTHHDVRIIRTFVLVKRERWLILQDHNTFRA
jgi:uncharacterized protein (TIGR02246 family)